MKKYIKARVCNPIKDGAGHFYDDPSDIAVSMENAIRNIDAGAPYITDVTLEYFEAEAIARFAKQTGMQPLVFPEKKQNRSIWLAKWVNVAESIDLNSSTINGMARSSIRVLLAAYRLRREIEINDNPQKIAALSMLLICEVFMGGYMLENESLREAIEGVEQDKARVYKNTIGAEADDQERARKYCINAAAKIWVEQPTRRIGNVSKELHEYLLANLDRLTTLNLTPKIDTIKGWLKTAALDNKLSIPPGAQMRGRPSKSII